MYTLVSHPIILIISKIYQKILEQKGIKQVFGAEYFQTCNFLKHLFSHKDLMRNIYPKEYALKSKSAIYIVVPVSNMLP